jgi:NAD(P)-dependent dehydrogenase (short-subunit alcohol dehydrogenase family)
VTRIAGLGLSSTALQETAKVLQKQFPKAEFLELFMNLSDRVQVEATFIKLVERFRRIDYAVNNAALGSLLLLSTELSSATFNKIMSVDLKGM